MSTIFEQLALPFSLPESMARADFHIAPANALALTQIEGWRDWPQGRMALTGPRGAGKTHLTHIWAAEAGAVVLTPDDIRSTSPAALAVWGHIAVEDADALAGDADAERALFHLHNLVVQNGGRLLLTARAEPARWPVGLPDLRSRLSAMPVARLESPDDALLLAVLGKLFADRQLAVPPELADWLVLRMERTLGAARRIVALLDARALAERRPINQRLAAEVLESLHPEHRELSQLCYNQER